MRFFHSVLLLLLAVMSAGCATFQDNVSFELASQPVYYKDQWARRDPPLVYVHPQEKVDRELTAVMMPFRVTQKITDPEMIGYTQARVVWQSWLADKLFSTLEFDGDHGPYRRDIAINLARQKGADLAVGGFVTYYYAGGSEWESQISLQIEIYDAASGQLVWSLAQSALMPARQTKDYILFATQTRLPTDPMYALAKVIAEDTGRAVRSWMIGADGVDPQTGEVVREGYPTF